MLSDSRGHATEIQRANINIECAGSLSGAVSSFILTPCSVRDASDSCYLLPGPKDQPPLFKRLPQNSWSGDPNAGSRPPDGCCRNKHFTITTFIILCLVMQVTEFKTRKVPVTESFCAALLTPACSQQLLCQLSKICVHAHTHAHKLQSNC